MSFLGSFFEEKVEQQHILVVDVGSGSIGAALVLLKNGSLPVVVASSRKEIAFQESLDVRRFVSLMQNSLNETIDDIINQKLSIQPTKVLFGLASPWNTSQTHFLHINKNEDFQITEKGLSVILKNESSLFVNAPFDADGPKELMQNSLIESRAMQIKLNGYEVPSPVGIKARDIEIALYLSMMPERIKEVFEDTISKRWPHVVSYFHSFMFAAFNAIRDSYQSSATFLIVDVAGEVTDVALVRDNVLVESLSFPLGYHAINRMAMRELKLQHAAASSEIDEYLKGNSTLERKEVFDQIFAKVIREWKLLFVGAIHQLKERYPIPRSIYHFIDQEYADYYSSAIRDSSSRVLDEADSGFDLHALDETFFAQHIHLAEGQRADIFLCVIIMISQKLLEADFKG